MTALAVARRAAAGAAAGIAATAVMSGVMAAAAKLHLLGEPPPRKLVRRMLAAAGLGRPRGAGLDALGVIAHFAFGAGMGALYALAPRVRGLAPLGAPVANAASRGAVFGSGVWAANYAGWIPKVGLMQPPSKDRPGRPTSMFVAHLVFGATLGSLYQALTRRLVLNAAVAASP